MSKVIESYFKVCFSLLSLGLPGGDLVDGLRPAASTDSVSASWPGRQLQNYSRIWGRFFEKVEFLCL